MYEYMQFYHIHQHMCLHTIVYNQRIAGPSHRASPRTRGGAEGFPRAACRPHDSQRLTEPDGSIWEIHYKYIFSRPFNGKVHHTWKLKNGNLREINHRYPYDDHPLFDSSKKCQRHDNSLEDHL